MQVNPILNSKYGSSFKSMHVYDQEARKLILKSVNTKQLEELKDIFYKQADNQVFCFIFTSKNKKHLEARIMCRYFINNFKEYYKQIPIFESKFHFVKRMSEQMDKYQAILDKAQKT